MTDHDDLTALVEEITQWQLDAQNLPLTDLSDATACLLNDLGQVLNEFNATFGAWLNQGQPEDVLADEVGHVARHALAAAIYALGLNQRIAVQLTAERN